MQIVIDIPDILMEYIVKGRDLSEEQNDEMAYAITDGIPLPKGHGRLIDADALYPNCDYDDGMYYAVSLAELDSATTIIEADNGE